LTGPVFLFGQIHREEGAAPPASRLAGQTGVAWKVPAPGAAELLLRCGPELSPLGSLGLGRAPEHFALPVQPHWLRLDAQCRWSLANELGLEYQGTACPAFNPWERDRISQDLRLVVPVGRDGQLQLGARYSWESGDEAKPGPEGSQLYVGVRLRW
jgi:hypothetical protein